MAQLSNGAIEGWRNKAIKQWSIMLLVMNGLLLGYDDPARTFSEHRPEQLPPVCERQVAHDAAVQEQQVKRAEADLQRPVVA